MASIYVQHRINQLLPTALPPEGQVFPLLRRVGDSGTDLNWAFAVPKAAANGELAAVRKNRLVVATLRALGFQLDPNNSAAGTGFDDFDYFHLPDSTLIDPLPGTAFDALTLPDLPSMTGGTLVVFPPKGGAPELKLATGAAGQRDIKAGAPFDVDRFEFKEGARGHFDLRGAGDLTDPAFVANVTLPADLRQEFPNGVVPVLNFDQAGVAGQVRCNNSAIVAGKNNPGGATIAADDRHDRLTLDVAALVCLTPDAVLASNAGPTLAVDIFPAISFQPLKNLPVVMSVAQQGVHLRLMPNSAADKTPRLIVNRFRPCVHFTIRGPVIHANATGTGALEALRLLEPAERKFKDTVEQINDFLVYSFEVCVPPDELPNLTLPELLWFEQLSLPLPGWTNVAFAELQIDKLLKPFFARLTAGLELPDPLAAPTLRQVKLDLSKLGLPLPEHLDLLDLRLTDLERWKDLLRLHRPDGVLLERLPIQSLTLTGFELVVDLSANFPGLLEPDIGFALHFPRFNLHGARFPDVGLPSLTEFDFPNYVVDLGANTIKVTFPEGLVLPALKECWSVRLKRPNAPDIDLPALSVSAPGVDAIFTFDPLVINLSELKLVLKVDVLRIKWAFEKPDLNLNTITLKTPLPQVRLPLIDADIDFRLIKLRAQIDGVVLATFSISKILADLKGLELDVPLIDGNFPDLEPLTRPGVTLDFTLDLTLPLTKCFLTDLLGDLDAVDFRVSVPQPIFPDLTAIRAAFGSMATPIVPLELVVRVPHPTLPKLKWDELKIVLGMRFDLAHFKLLDNRIYFFLPQRRSLNANLAPRQAIDFDIFTLTFPNRPEPMGFPTKDDHDGYLDLTAREFVIDLKYPGVGPQPPPRIHAYFPGGMVNKAARLGREGVESLPESDPDRVPFLKEYTKRFDLELDTVDPQLWPATGPDRLMFRFNSRGLTFAANLGKTEVVVDSSGFDDKGEPEVSTSGEINKAGLIKPFKCQPQEKQRELTSRLVVIDNELKEAGVYAKTEVPGVDKLMAEVSVVLRQRKKGMLPDVLASLELERADEAPLAELSIKLLELSLDRIELGLIWRREEKEWDYSIIADGTVAFTGAAALVPDLEGLRAPSIQLIGLDLRRMNLREMRVPLNLVKPVRFDILDGMFGVELGDLELGWSFEGGLPKPRLLACELAKLTFKNPGALEVTVSVGGLHIEFDEKLKAHVKLPSSLGIEVALGTTARFAGRVGWIETPIERYLFASGKLMLEGLPEIRGLLKFGTGLKLSGRREINLVLYGEQDYDEQLFAGAVVKSLGLGIGLNNRLAAIPPSPSADAILRNIDLVKPGEVEGWQFVQEGGFYLSVIGSVTLASNLGDPKVLNAYVAALVVSIDSNFDLVAAGKCWLSCSLNGSREYPNNPAFVGAMVLSPRQRKLELVLESRKNAHVEQNDLIKKLLDKGNVRFAFRMTPQLVDFHLAELSYRDEMFGVQMEFVGEYRFAIFKRAVLLKNELSATGSISRSLNAGPGGFDLDGRAALHVGYGGLLSDKGIMAYAFLDLSIRFRVSAWIEIGFSISFRVCGKRFTISWSVVFRIGVPQMELTFRGHVAVADHGGFVSVDCQVGINVVICGYCLRASGRLAINPELYQEVRATVSAFEAELEAAVKALDQPASNALDQSASAPAPSSDPVTVPSESVAESASSTSLLSTSESASSEADTSDIAAATGPRESWLLYLRELGETSYALLLPRQDSPWLTPTIAVVEAIDVTSPGGVLQAKFATPAGIGPLPPSAGVRLLGLRSGGVPTALNDVTWPVLTSDSQSITLDLRGSANPIPEGTYSGLLGGVWYIQESAADLNPADHDTVPYFDEVERAVLRTSGWLRITNVNGTTVTTNAAHNISGDVRVVLREAADRPADAGRTRRHDDTDVAHVTVLAQPHATDPNQLILSELGDLTPASGWELATALEIAPTWSGRNRLAARRDGTFTPDNYREHTAAAAAWAETAGRPFADEPAAVGGETYAVIFDQRYASADPRFSPVDAPVEPGVLSARFRPLDDVEIVGADAVLESGRRYEQASAAVARKELHGALDLEDSEALQQSRAQSAQLLVHRLSEPRGPQPGERLEAPVTVNPEDHSKSANPSKIAYGWFLRIDSQVLKVAADAVQHGESDRLLVRRAGRPIEVVEITTPKSASPDEKLQPERLPIRQDFVIDEASDVRERGRVVVKLPVRYPDAVLRRPHDLGRVQVYRQIGDAPEELIADQLRPDVSHVDRQQVYSRSRQVFVDDPLLQEDIITSDNLFTGIVDIIPNPVPHPRLTIRGDQIRLLPANVKLVGFRCRANTDTQRGFTVVRDNLDERATVDPVLLEFAPETFEAGPLTFAIVADGLIVQRPVLISDEFTVIDREFESAALRAARGAGRIAMVKYSLRLLAEDDPGAKAGVPLRWSDPVPLFVPRRTPAPPSLALAVSVGGLLQSESTASGLQFQLLDLGSETPKLVEQDGRPLMADDFEFWLDGDILRQSGFFAGEAEDPAPNRETDGERVTLANVSTTGDIESTAGKLPVGVVPVPGSFSYRFVEPVSGVPLDLQPGAAFRAFVRRKGDTAVRSLRRLPVLLVRNIPAYWDSTVRYRITDTLEIIPDAHADKVRRAQADAVVTDFSADDRYDAGRAAVRVVWPSQTLMDGGVELQFRDFDDSSLRSRTLVEVLEADEFAVSQRDFRDDSFWTPRPTERLERYVSRIVASATVPTGTLFKSVYLWVRAERLEIDAISRLKAAKALFVAATNWIDLADAAKKVQTALLAYEKSPLNLDRVDTRQRIGLLRLALRAVVVGNFVGTTSAATGSPADKLTLARAANQTLLERLTQIEQTKAETVSDAAATDAAFLDRDTARKLSGIVRRRLAIADEVVSLRDTKSAPGVDLSLPNHPPLAREPAWQNVIKDAQSMAEAMQRTLPVTDSLVEKFDAGGAAKELCESLIDEIVIDINSLELEKLVPRAAGLSELIDRVDKLIREDKTANPAGALKRPHHELTTTQQEDGQIVARPIPLRVLLPSRARQAKLGTLPPETDERLERLGIRVGHVATLSVDGHVTLWTTRGDSVQTTSMERVQHFQIGATAVRSFALDEAPTGPRLLVAATFGGNQRVQLLDAGTTELVREFNDAGAAVFAPTPRGLEVAVVRGSKVALETTEPDPDPAKEPGRTLREPLEFVDGELTTPFDGPVAYHDEINILAAARGSEILFWRDLGRPENKTPFYRLPLGKLATGPEHATHIQCVTLPSGAGFVIAAENYKFPLFFFDPLPRNPEPVPVREDVGAVTDLAVDRRELTVSAVIDGRIETYRLLRPDEGPKHGPAAAHVAVLHGREEGKDESYLVVPSGDEVQVRDDVGASLRQTLPAAAELGGTVVAGNIVAVATHLMTARSAVASVDPLSLFHLWERMGFAVDIAAQDVTTRLLPLTELRQVVAEAVGAMESPIVVNGQRHYVYVVEGEEPDAEFRDDRVGFSHVNVAVVPEAFLAACLSSDRTPLEKWLDCRAIVPAKSVDGEEKQRELEYITQATRLVGVPHARRFGKRADATEAVDGVQIGGTLRLQPSSERFVRVPASAGFSHWSWTLPDRKGHRLLAAARRVSRYEPLLRWWLNLHTRFDLPEEVSLKRVGTNDHIHTVAAPASKIAVTLSGLLEPATGWQPLRIEVVEGPGAGQRREIDAISGATLSIDAGDPWQTDLVVGQSKCRVLDAAPGWRLVTLDPVHDPARGEGSRSLMVYQYPHSRRPQFSYQIPLDGMRATYNQISRVRTGYHGVEAAFRYFLSERTETGDAPTLPNLLLSVVVPDSGDNTVVPPDRTVFTVANGSESVVRLFRHERLVSLPGLPFFYRYRLDVRSAYKARRLESDRSTAADRLPDDENASPPARRLPTCLGLYDVQASNVQQTVLAGTLPSDPDADNVIRVAAAGTTDPLPSAGLVFRARAPGGGAWGERAVVLRWADGVVTLSGDYPGSPKSTWDFELTPHEYEVTLLASANRDHLTREESASEPNPVVVNFALAAAPDFAIAARDLPDFFMEYRLAALVPVTATIGPLPSLGDLFVQSGFVRLPWSPKFLAPSGFSNRLPLVSLSSGQTGRLGYAVVPAEKCKDINDFKKVVSDQLGAVWENAAAIEIQPLGKAGSFRFKTTTAGSIQDAVRGWQSARDPALGVSQLEVEAREELHAVLVRVTGLSSSGRDLSVPLELVTSGTTQFWRLRFRVALDRGRAEIDGPDRFFIQGERDGRLTRARPMQVVGD